MADIEQQPRSDDAPPTQAELIAQAYNRKKDALAHQAAERMGRPYGTRAVDWDQLVTEWDTPDPDVDEGQVWDKVLNEAVQALADDPSLDQDRVLGEIPIQVAEIVYPSRKEIIKAGGGTTYREWADFSDEIEKRAAKTRDARLEARRKALGLTQPPEPPTPPAEPPLPEPVPEQTSLAEVLAPPPAPAAPLPLPAAGGGMVAPVPAAPPVGVPTAVTGRPLGAPLAVGG